MANFHDSLGSNPNDIPTISPDHQTTVGASHASHPSHASHLNQYPNQSASTQGASGDLKPGAYLGPYLLQSELGRGGMGVVYRALDNQLRRVVALKVLIAGEDASDMAVARFQLEAEAVAKLGQHPNIVPVFDIGRQGRLQYFSMEFVDGRPLDQLIAGSEITPRRAALLTLGVCQGLVQAHEQGILHRDIKPANILIDQKGTPKITDFGLAKDLDEDSGLTQSGVTMGSPLYMSPEQANGETELIDQRSDIYSLGATFYQMLTGSPPFQGKTTLALIQKILMEEAENPSSRNPSVDQDLASICLKCIEKEPERRYSSATEVAADLEAYLDGRPVTAKPVTRRRRFMLWYRRNRGFAFMTGLAILALLTALVTALWFSWLKEIVDDRNAQEYKRRTLTSLSVLLNDHLSQLRSDIDKETDKTALIEQFSKDSVREVLRTNAMLGNEEVDEALLQEALRDYRAEPDLSRIAFTQKEWFRAYRFDPNGAWGLRAQIEIAKSFNKRREFGRTLSLLERVLGQLPNLLETFNQQDKSLAEKIELEALDTLFVAQSERGEQDQLRAILKRRRALRSNEEDAKSREISRILRAIGGTRQEILVGKRLPGGLGYEHFEHLKLESKILLLANRKGRPAFKFEAGQLKQLPVSPLAKIEETVYINRLRAADINGDGKTDILAAVTKGGKGGLIILEKKGLEWTPTFAKIDSVAHAYDLVVGDFNGDQIAEAFLIFKWQAGYHWYIGFNKDFYCSQVRLNPKAPYVGGGYAFDINDDGRDELLLGRPATVNGKIEVYRVTAGLASPSIPQMTILASTLIGGARAFAKDETGLIAATVSIPKSFGKDRGMVEYNGLSLLRWDNGQLNRLKHHSFGYRNEGTMSSMGPVHKGRLLGDRAFFWHSNRYLNESPAKSSAVIPEAISQGVKLQFLIGGEGQEPILIGYPGGIFATTLADLDGDENSELLVLVDRGFGEATLKVHGAPKKAPPAVRVTKTAQSTGSEGESLLKTVLDLLEFGSPDSFREAYELAGQLGRRYANIAVGQQAQCLRVTAQMKLGQYYEKEAGKKYLGFNYKRYSNLTALATHKYPDLYSSLDDGERLSKLSIECYKTAAKAVRTMAPKQRHVHTRDQLLRMGREAARKTLDWTALKAFNEQLSNESFPGPIAHNRLEELRKINSPACEVLSGRFADADLPLRVDFPFRAKTVVHVERGKRKKDLEVVLDVHSQRSYIGYPINYQSGAFEFEIDLETAFSAWGLRIYFGLIPRSSTMPTQFDPDPKVLENHFSQAGVIRFISSSIHRPERTDATFKVLGSPRQNLKNQRGKWTFKYLFSPETKTVSLTVYDRRRQRVVSRYQRRVDYKLNPGRYLLGLSMGYVHGTSLRYHAIYPPYTHARLGAVKLKGVNIQLDKSEARDLQGLAQQAGAAFIQGREDKAIELYKKVLDLEPRHFLARLHLSVLLDSVDLFQESIAMDPYAFALIIDDAFRGAHLEKIKKLGQLLQRSSKKYPGFCAPFLGDSLVTQRSTLGPSAAARYLRMRLKSRGYGEDHGWLRDRQMRHPGTELPEIFWAPSDTSKVLSLKQLRAVTKETDKGRLLEYWIHLSRSLILDPENRDALLLRAFAAANYGEHGRATNDLRRRAELKPNDWKGWRDLADFLSSRFGLIEETLDALERALRSGASRKILEGKHYQYLSGNSRFKALKKTG